MKKISLNKIKDYLEQEAYELDIISTPDDYYLNKIMSEKNCSLTKAKEYLALADDYAERGIIDTEYDTILSVILKRFNL